MDKETLGVAILAGSAVCATVAGLIRYGLLPYLREQLALNREIHQQVTAISSPADQPPTMHEQVNDLAVRVEDVAGKVDEHTGELEDATLELRAMALMFDGHLDWAQREVDKLRNERQRMVDELWAELRRQRDAGRTAPHHRKDVNPQ